MTPTSELCIRDNFDWICFLNTNCHQLAQASRDGQCLQVFVNKMRLKRHLQEQKIQILHDLQGRLHINNNVTAFHMAWWALVAEEIFRKCCMDVITRRLSVGRVCPIRWNHLKAPFVLTKSFLCHFSFRGWSRGGVRGARPPPPLDLDLRTSRVSDYSAKKRKEKKRKKKVILDEVEVIS